jgi:molecular chaperone DnaK
MAALNNAWQAASTEMYQGGSQAGGAADGAANNGANAGAGGNPDVSDVQYEEVK